MKKAIVLGIMVLFATVFTTNVYAQDKEKKVETGTQTIVTGTTTSNMGQTQNASTVGGTTHLGTATSNSNTQQTAQPTTTSNMGQTQQSTTTGHSNVQEAPNDDNLKLKPRTIITNQRTTPKPSTTGEQH